MAEYISPFDQWYLDNQQSIIDRSPSLLQHEVLLKPSGSAKVIRFDDMPSYLSGTLYGLVIHLREINERIIVDHETKQKFIEDVALFRVDILLRAPKDKNRVIVKYPKNINVYAEANSIILLKDLNNRFFKSPLNLEAIPIFKILDINRREDEVIIGPDDFDLADLV